MVKKKKDNQPPDKSGLTDWQKKNIEFLKKKQREEHLKLQKANQFILERRSNMGGQVASNNSSEKTEKNKKRRPIRVKHQPTARDKARNKALPVFIVAALILLIGTFYITPFSQNKELYISGNQHAQIEDIGKDTGIKATDYITSVWLFHKKYEKQLKNNNPWVREAKISYQFPNRFNIRVKEYGILAYTITSNGYQPILENGEKVAAVNATELPEAYLTINLSKDKQIKQLVASLVKVDPDLRRNIQLISLVPSKATKDLLQFDLYDGNTLRIPLSEVALKLPYYNKIKGTVEAPKIIDMEAGVYTTTPDIEMSSVSTEETKKEDSAESNTDESRSASTAETAAQTEATEASSESITTD